MRDFLMDVIKHIPTAKIDTMLVTCDTDGTLVQGCDDDRSFFIQARLNPFLPDFEGRFGLTNISLLNGLLNFANFQTEDATLTAKIAERPQGKILEELHFRNPRTGNSTDFRLMSPDNVTPPARINEVNWEVEVTPSKEKVAEFGQLASMFADVDKNFVVRTTEDGNLLFMIGDESASTHRVSMIFAEGVEGNVRGDQPFTAAQFLMVMKLVSSHKDVRLSVSNLGVLCISVETSFGHYAYYMRANIQ